MLQKIAVCLINIYQKGKGNLMPDSCRFWPSCSEYSKQAILKYGFLKGIFQTVKRLLRCHPLSKKSGYDPLS